MLTKVDFINSFYLTFYIYKELLKSLSIQIITRCSVFPKILKKYSIRMSSFGLSI